MLLGLKVQEREGFKMEFVNVKGLKLNYLYISSRLYKDIEFNLT